MSTTFFRKYPRIEYTTDDRGSSVLITDITRAVLINSMTTADDVSFYSYYDIVDGERPDVVSHKLYGDVQYYWTFFIVNDSLKRGYNSGWPINSNDFSKMIENEYGLYSAITFLPTANLNGVDNIDFSLVPLDEKYLPYLRLSLIDESYTAKILKYDTRLHQCIVYDIVDNLGRSAARESFVKYKITDFENPLLGKNDFKVVWDSSVRIRENDSETEQQLADKNIRLRKQWLAAAFENYAQVDSIGSQKIDEIEYVDDVDQFLYLSAKDNYVLNKKIVAASNSFRWNSYEYAAREYITDEGKTKTVYDIFADGKEVVMHDYKSNIDSETEINDSKSKIRVIRPEYIRQFVNEYYENLNA